MAEPTLSGPQGHAWRVPLWRTDPAHEACLAVWLVEAPGYHPAWSRWLMNLIHLRDIPGVKPAHRKFPSATHELVIAALDPESYGEHDAVIAGTPPKDFGWQHLTPIDVIEQFEVPADQMAVRIAELSVGCILDGKLSPDQDYRRVWHDVLATTAQHLREGRHAVA